MGNGRPKQRKDAVAQSLGDITFVAMDRIQHELKGGVNEAAGVFRVEAFNEGSGAFEVGKQRRDGLALAGGRPTGFHGSVFGQDALGEMWGGVANGSRV